MKKNKKIALLIVVVALVAAIGVGATLAYFSDKDSNTNVVTMGHVDIALTETSTDENVRITDNGLKFTDVMPGAALSKVPTVTVDTASQPSWIRMSMTFEGLTDEQANELVALLDIQSGWHLSSDGYYYYDTAVAPGTSVDFFTTVKIPAGWDNTMADKSFSIVLQAEAIQESYVSYDTTNVAWIDADGNALDNVTIQQYK